MGESHGQLDIYDCLRMRVLVACEMSGRVRDAFIARGHQAISCDVLPSLAPGPHFQGDVLPLLREPWDLVIGFPPCTDLAASNAHNLKVKEADGRMQVGYEFFKAIYYANSPRVCVENPIGVIPRYFRKADQIIDPWWFGDPYLKRTCLWLRGLPPLRPTHERGDVTYWHHGSGYNSGHRYGRGRASTASERALTFPGVARAMAEQWG